MTGNLGRAWVGALHGAWLHGGVVLGGGFINDVLYRTEAIGNHGLRT